MANVKFLRGLSTSLSSATVQDGAFYLTTDTNRLYVGQGTDLVELNKSITSVTNVASLPTTNVADGQFYYASAENILCYYDSSKNPKWVQINPDTNTNTFIKNEAIVSVTAETSKATVKTTLNAIDKDGNSTGASITGAFAIAATGIVTVSADTATNVITIGADTPAATTYNLASSVASNVATIKLSGDNGTTTSVSSFTIAGSKQTTISSTNGGFVIETAPVEYSATINANGEFVNNYKYTSGSASTTLTPQINYGSSVTSAKFLSGTAALSVYTIAETDKKIEDAFSAFDGMIYKGTAASTAALSSTAAGSTYKATAAFKIDTRDVDIGDLVISKYDDSTKTQSWDIVPSGDDQTINVGTATNGITIYDSLHQTTTLGGIAISSGDSTTISSAYSGNQTTVTIAHGDKGTVSTSLVGSTADVSYQGGSSVTFTAITSLGFDKFGHVTTATTGSFSTTDWKYNLNSVTHSATAANNAATITETIAGSNGSVSSTFALNTSSLSVTSSGSTVSVDLTWGSF